MTNRSAASRPSGGRSRGRAGVGGEPAAAVTGRRGWVRGAVRARRGLAGAPGSRGVWCGPCAGGCVEHGGRGGGGGCCVERRGRGGGGGSSSRATAGGGPARVR